MLDRLLDGPVPTETEVAVAGLDRQLRVEPLEPGPVDIELPVVENVEAEPLVPLDDLSAEHAVERVRAPPVGDGDHTVVESHQRSQRTTSSRAFRRRVKT